MRIGVIVNARAAGAARDPGLATRLGAIVEGQGEVVVTRSVDELPRAAERFRAAELVAICGGDGTYSATVSELLRQRGELPRLALLRAGTVNTIAENLGIAARPEEALGRIAARRRAGEPIIESGQDLLEVNGRHGFLFAAAMGARFLEAYYGGPGANGSPGIGWALALWLRTVASTAVAGSFARRLFAEVPCSIVADGEPVPLGGARMIVASVVPDVGIGMKVAWRAGLQPNRFHLVVSSLPLGAMFRQLGRVLRGRPLDGAAHEDRLVREAELSFADEQPYTLDGDLFRARRVRLRVGPRVWIVRG